jgi:hypothetical protein
MTYNPREAEILDTLRGSVDEPPPGPGDRVELIVGRARSLRRRRSAWLVGTAAASTLAVALSVAVVRGTGDRAGVSQTAGTPVSVEVIKDAIRNTFAVRRGHLKFSYHVDAPKNGGFASMFLSRSQPTIDVAFDRDARLVNGTADVGMVTGIGFAGSVVDGVVYRSVTPDDREQRVVPASVKWVSQPLTATKLTLVEASIAAAATSAIDDLPKVITGVRDMGEADLDGEPAQRYTVTAAPTARFPLPPSVDKASMTLDVFVARSGVIRRLRMVSHAEFPVDMASGSFRRACGTDSRTGRTECTDSGPASGSCTLTSSGHSSCKESDDAVEEFQPVPRSSGAPDATDPLSFTMTAQVDLTDVGKEIAVTAPPADSVITETALSRLPLRKHESVDCAPPNPGTPTPKTKEEAARLLREHFESCVSGSMSDLGVLAPSPGAP